MLNLKVYPNCLGADAEKVAVELERLGAAAGVAVAIAPAAPDVGRVVAAVRIPVLGQHTDPVDPGARTGSVPAEAWRACGARGSLLNHSEHPMAPLRVEDAARRLVANGLVPVVCARDVEDARMLAAVKAPYLAVEPPELIGGPRSVSTAAPEVIGRTVAAVAEVAPATHVLCGAGVLTRSDVRRALELGSRGVLVASAVTRAPVPSAAIAELLSGF
ncbi:MAG TPA: triose-phosphate isomerase [Thermoplasmata archaeon]|nr:triose-phosphate isomerase [Thermoplasmata archaeon]